MQEIYRVLARLMQTDLTVMISGESGTGKELIARAIHEASSRRDRPLIRVNCAAIPRELFESEFFGHVRGAFTGAMRDRIGRFELADGGTIFLDEIGTISLAVQAKLLRVLQDREFEPLGAERTQKVDVRVIAATNRDLRQLVSDGKFLEDLFYRLNVIPIGMPPLRERREDIPLLVEHFVKRFAERTGKQIDGVDEKAMLELARYEWPGNVRELENTIERAVVLATTPLLTSRTVWLMSATATPAAAAVPSLKLHQNLEWAERETMRRALEQARGVKKDAAELMGISQRALSHYLAKYRIET
jgi:transcriptional regulator with GAF, ATPase, and Fis domain